MYLNCIFRDSVKQIFNLRYSILLMHSDQRKQGTHVSVQITGEKLQCSNSAQCYSCHKGNALHYNIHSKRVKLITPTL